MEKNMETENSVDISSFSAEGAKAVAKEEARAKHEKPSEPRAPRKKNRKKKRHLVLWIVLGFFAAFIITGVILVNMVLADFTGSGRNGDLVTITVKEGSTVTEIAQLLKDAGAIDNPELFRIYSSIAETDVKYHPGTFEFKNNIGYKAIAKELMQTKQFAKSVTVTIPEGTGIHDYVKDVNGKDVTVPGIATLLEKAGVCTKEDFFAALDAYKLDSKLLKNVNTNETYCPLEGYLFPDTYQFYFHDSKECAKLAVEKMVERSEKLITNEMYARAEQLGYSMNEILTMASIIQMESGNSKGAMADVAAVFYNRLNSPNFATLGSSPTCYYGTFNEKDDDRYDTYKCKGLPPGPLCSPGAEAIKAALYPSDNTTYFYFITDAKGKFYFHKTLAEQNAKIKQLQKEGNWIYEYF